MCFLGHYWSLTDINGLGRTLADIGGHWRTVTDKHYESYDFGIVTVTKIFFLDYVNFVNVPFDLSTIHLSIAHW